MYLGGGVCAPPGPYPEASSSCILIRPGFLCIEGRSLGWVRTIIFFSLHTNFVLQRLFYVKSIALGLPNPIVGMTIKGGEVIL